MHHNYANEPLVRERYSEVRPTDDSSFRIRYRIRSLHFVCFFFTFIYLFFLRFVVSFFSTVAGISQHGNHFPISGEKKTSSHYVLQNSFVTKSWQKKKNRPAGANQNGKQEGKKTFAVQSKRFGTVSFFLCCFLVCSGVTLLFCFVAVDLVCAAQSGWRKRRPSRCARPTSRRWASDCASPSSTHPVRPPSPLLPFTGFHRVLPSFTGFYQILPGFTGFYRV